MAINEHRKIVYSTQESKAISKNRITEEDIGILRARKMLEDVKETVLANTAKALKIIDDYKNGK